MQSPADAVGFLNQLKTTTGGSPVVFRLLGQALRATGDEAGARAAEAEAIGLAAATPALSAAIRHMMAHRFAQAEAVIRPHLAAEPEDVAAICLLAEVANRVGIYAEAEKLYRRALTLAPGFADAQVNLAKVLFQTSRSDEALGMIAAVLADDPRHSAARQANLTMLGQIGEYDASLAAHETALAGNNDARLWLSYANVLKTVGRRNDSVAAYRRSLVIDSTLGEAWWSLANLKSAALGPADIATMERLLASGVGDECALHLHFALGKALEEAGQFPSSFRHYEAGNALRRRTLPYDPGAVTAEVDRCMALFTPDFFAAHRGTGSPSAEPIFIVGMPRAGSTLIEQILASHSQVEGTSELPDIPLLVHQLMAERWGNRSLSYPQILRDLPQERLAALGERYLAAAAAHRKTDRPYFIDKLPNNWLYVGFIQLILPNATIIDARREAMACCLSNFTQHFARGQAFSYSLRDVGRYYRDYVRLMTHVDAVLPDRVTRVDHEELLADPGAGIGRLLARLNLPFEDACVRFHENDRPVRTASAEQVRRPITRDAVDRWQAYAPWLRELGEALALDPAAEPAYRR